MRFSESTHLLFLSLETLTSTIRTDLPILVELIDLVNSVTIFPSQMTLLRWSTFLLESQAVILIVLLFWIYIFLLALVFVLQWHCSIGKVWSCCCRVSIDFPSNSQQDLPFHCIAHDYSCADWDGLCDHLRDVPWENIFKLGACAASSQFCEWVHVGTDVYISHRKYQAKSHSSLWLSGSCAAAIVHRNHFFHLNQKDKSSNSEVKFRQASNHC